MEEEWILSVSGASPGANFLISNFDIFRAELGVSSQGCGGIGNLAERYVTTTVAQKAEKSKHLQIIRSLDFYSEKCLRDAQRYSELKAPRGLEASRVLRLSTPGTFLVYTATHAILCGGMTSGSAMLALPYAALLYGLCKPALLPYESLCELRTLEDASVASRVPPPLRLAFRSGKAHLGPDLRRRALDARSKASKPLTAAQNPATEVLQVRTHSRFRPYAPIKTQKEN